MAKQPSLKHVKFTRTKGKLYAYFNTGRKLNGKPVFNPLPPFGSIGFYDSYAAMLGARSKRETLVYTVADLCDAYEASEAFTQRAAGTQKTYAVMLGRIREHLGRAPMDQVKRKHILDILDKNITGNASRNLFLSVVSVIYRYARERDMTNANPTDAIRSFDVGTHEPWPEELLEAALASDSNRIRLAVHLLYYTGQRIGDVVKLRWSDIRSGALVVTPQKTQRYNKMLRVPLHSALEAELERTAKTGITIITGRMGKPITQRPLRDELQAFAAELGFEIVPHGLRKNAVNSLLEAGCTPHEVAAITGQSFQMIEHYARRVSQHRLGEAAIFKLERKSDIQTDFQTAPQTRRKP